MIRSLFGEEPGEWATVFPHLVHIECLRIISVLRPDTFRHKLTPHDGATSFELVRRRQVLEPSAVVVSPILPVKVLVFVSEVKEFVSFLASQKVRLELDVGNFDFGATKRFRSGQSIDFVNGVTNI